MNLQKSLESTEDLNPVRPGPISLVRNIGHTIFSKGKTKIKRTCALTFIVRKGRRYGVVNRNVQVDRFKIHSGGIMR